MVIPVLLTRMKKQGHRLGLEIDACEIGAFVAIAVDTGETEVRIIVAAMLERADVQGGERGIFLMGLAIFGSLTGAFPNQGSRGGFHAALPDWNFLASRRGTATNRRLNGNRRTGHSQKKLSDELDSERFWWQSNPRRNMFPKLTWRFF